MTNLNNISRTAPREAFSELYSAYAAGVLDPAFALMVETQAALRPDIASEMQLSEAMSAAMLDDEPEAMMSEGALERTLARIDKLEAKTSFAVEAAKSASTQLDEFAALPQPLLDRASDAMVHNGWKSAAPGISCLSLETTSDAEVELIRIEPNRAVPRHSHGGKEYTLVVAGGFTDETGSYGPGDLSVKGPEDIHQPVADDGEVCYALAVRHGKLHLTGVLGVLQKILGK